MFDHDLGGPLYSEISEGNEIVPTFKGQVRVKIDWKKQLSVFLFENNINLIYEKNIYDFISLYSLLFFGRFWNFELKGQESLNFLHLRLQFLLQTNNY